MRRFPARILAGGMALLLLVTSVGCRTNPESESGLSESSLAVPNFSGIPDQWEPEVTETVDPIEDELELGL